MAEPNTKRSSLDGLKGIRKRAGRSTEPTPPERGSGSGSSLGLGSTGGVPCGACKFLRRKCANGCVFAPHFSPEQGTALFAAVHKVFGASNVSKLLVQLPLPHRHHAVETILYEAQARLSDPVYGCVSIIIALQQQIAALQMELAMVQEQVINARLMAANTLQGSLQQPNHLNNLELQQNQQVDLHPVYLNGSSASNNNMINMNMFDSSLHNLANDNQNVVHSQPMFDPLQFAGPFYQSEDDVDEESGYPLVFADQML